jgi:hypothetical protein
MGDTVVTFIERTAGTAAVALVAIIAYRKAKRQRREQRFDRYMAQLHAQSADLGTTLAHFWLGQLFARYGTDAQLDDWIRLTHGYPPFGEQTNKETT